MKPILLLLVTVCAALTLSCKEDAYGPVPSEAQLQWHDMEYYMFCHFGPNTFTGVEWGNGEENPDVFNPSELDCEQWVRTAIAAGMKGIILTAKHHDGFCLWPSKFSNHTVARSKWLDGKGDVVAQLRAACDKYDFPMGIYISPWDRNHPSYGSDEYNSVFASTVDEVHENYGPFFEQWFDGANGGANVPKYDWPLFNGTVFKHNPNAVIFSDVGPGCRWCGNENGYAGETNWNLINVEGFAPGKESPARESLFEGEPEGANWIPAECDVPLRDGWFWCEGNNGTQKSVEALMDIWFGSVGHGANLILNLSPDTRGLIPYEDSLRVMEFKAARDAYFSNLISCKKNCRSKISFKFKSPSKCIVLKEDIKYGQRIREFVIELKDGDNWSEIARGTTIGHKRIVRFEEPVRGELRVRVTDSFAKPLIKSAELY